MPDDKPKWDQPINIESQAPDLAAELAREHGITPQRAQMLIDRLGTDRKVLKAAAEGLRVHLASECCLVLGVAFTPPVSAYPEMEHLPSEARGF